MKRFKQYIIKIMMMVFITSTASASDLPDPEALAKQYIKDLCTLNEQDFTHKYMLTQHDAEDFINEMLASYKRMNKTQIGKMSDSIELKNAVQEHVVQSYREFKQWQQENQIDSSKIVYHSCDFELKKEREIPFYRTDIVKIYFKADTTNYAVKCDGFVFLQNKWAGGEIETIYPVDKSFNLLESSSYGEYADYATDTVAVYNENDYGLSAKKQIKIQKKIDALDRKIDALYRKRYE
ncbi:hypothetical protein [Cytophaga aurantiaca]|uniref:hypothetical protein n=1 Tax=Cytophaga aurantiaca TaxID=29530 RepID=UPI00036EB87B|nr:hypothetical protein [Cytophaga aurantiaca]